MPQWGGVWRLELPEVLGMGFLPLSEETRAEGSHLKPVRDGWPEAVPVGI